VGVQSRFGDLVVGIDFHLELVPGSPTPIPFPHPHCSIIGSPNAHLMAELAGMANSSAGSDAPKPGGPVLIGGAPATVTGEVARMPVKHIIIPPGLSFARGVTPSDAKLITGSKTVLFRGANAVRAGDPAMPCSDPLRLPTGLVVSTGGANVLVGGPAAIDFGAATGTTRRFPRRKQIRTKEQIALAQTVIPEKIARYRRIAPKSACYFTGHASGKPVGILSAPTDRREVIGD
jgi:uncharacterized Zn-binding protein involved in type VI secretion